MSIAARLQKLHGNMAKLRLVVKSYGDRCGVRENLTRLRLDKPAIRFDFS